ncbi:hypothetical protein [Rahnella selenatireducens]|uniref:hypothetical protein n=1 Tax=Rahnella selenatireducens TaxID=3389797 RepID=UPI003968AAF7
MNDFSQADYDTWLEWSVKAVEQLAAEAGCIFIIDVMSFSTCVSVATERRFDGTGFTLSPCSLLDMPGGTRLVLPSPNGSTLELQRREFTADVELCLQQDLSHSACKLTDQAFFAALPV